MGERHQNAEAGSRFAQAHDTFAGLAAGVANARRAAGERLSGTMRRLGAEARQHLDPERLRDGALAGLSVLLQAGGERLQAWSRRADEATIYEAGAIASAGTLTCLNCGRVLHLSRTSPVPPCPDCLAARFRKSY